MTDAFAHHDAIEKVEKGQWLRCSGPISARGEGGSITLQPGTILRVIYCVGGQVCAHFDAGGLLVRVGIPEKWWHCLELIDQPPERAGRQEPEDQRPDE